MPPSSLLPLDDPNSSLTPHIELASSTKKDSIEILKEAYSIMGHIPPRYYDCTESWQDHPMGDELDLESMMNQALTPEWKAPDPMFSDIHLRVRKTKESYRIICIDTSLSMTAQKRDILALSSAILLIATGAKNTGIITFNSSASILHEFSPHIHPLTIIDQILNMTPKGYTNIGEAIKKAKEIQNGKVLPHSEVILITDGKYTEGINPLKFLSGNENLHILEVGEGNKNHPICLQMAKKGGGKHYLAAKPEQTPTLLYRLIKGVY